MRDHDHAWIQRLLAACERAIADLAPLDDPHQRDLLDDLTELSERLRAELDAGRLGDGLSPTLS